MPPWRKYSTSTGVSIRSVSATSWTDPEARRIRSVMRWRGESAPSTPGRSSRSVPSSESAAGSRPSGSWNGSTPMPTRLARWIRSKLRATTARTPSSLVPLAAQSREEPVPYSCPAKTSSGTPSAA